MAGLAGQKEENLKTMKAQKDLQNCRISGNSKIPIL